LRSKEKLRQLDVGVLFALVERAVSYPNRFLIKNWGNKWGIN
jgi:hypothetical protein